jgi:hypothetical protein
MASVYETYEGSKNGQKNREHAFEPGPFGDEYPGIWDALSRELWKGKPVVPCTLSIFAQDGRATVCLQDRHFGRKAFKSAEGVSEALESLEKGIQGHSLEWRQERRRGPRT